MTGKTTRESVKYRLKSQMPKPPQHLFECVGTGFICGSQEFYEITELLVLLIPLYFIHLDY